MRQERQQSIAEEDELEDLENITSDIKDWLTSTFATKPQVWLRFWSDLSLPTKCSRQGNPWRLQS